ncbi:MAG: hypothetical protein IIW75_04160 [Bacteroidaceae bacterium]|nr:hypothetical protein [Bacteroidaceae bacterium]
MNFDKRKYIYLAIVTILAIATLYVIYSLIKDGAPTDRSQNEYIRDANELHNDSLYEEAVEPYMKALEFGKQQSLVNYNIATNSLKKNLKELEKAFTQEGYVLDSTVVIALNDANKRLGLAAKGQLDTAKYSVIYHNIGVGKHMRDSLYVAAEAYKEALRKNPANENARYNLAVILYQIKQEQEQQQNQQQNQQDKNEDSNKDEKEQEKENPQQNNGEEQNQEKESQQTPQQQQEQDEELEKIEQILKALMQDEKEIREKLEEIEIPRGGNYIEKNW